VLALGGGLSMLTVRRLDADEPAKASAPATEQSLHNGQARPPGQNALQIEPLDLNLNVVEIETKFLAIDPDKATEEEKSAKEVVEKAAERKLLRHEGVFVLELDADGSKKVLDKFQNLPAASLISSPRVMTLSGREATISMGAQVPVVAVDETVN